MENSPFKTLPSELRLNIFELAFAQPRPVVVSPRKSVDKAENDAASNRKSRTPVFVLKSSTAHLFALAQTCSQVRMESLRMVCRCNDFELRMTYLSGYWPLQTRSFFEDIEVALGPEHLSDMKSIVIVTYERIMFCYVDDFMPHLRYFVGRSKLGSRYKITLRDEIRWRHSDPDVRPDVMVKMDPQHLKRSIEEALKVDDLVYKPDRPWSLVRTLQSGSAVRGLRYLLDAMEEWDETRHV